MKEFIEIPFGAKDSELGGWEYTIPKGYTASIENGKIVVKKDDKDERMRNAAIRACQYMVEHFENSTKDYEDAIAWLEKQGKQSPTDEEMKILLQTEYEKGRADAIEQNTAWSEEDNYNIERLFCILNNEQDNYPQLSCDFQEIECIKNWLKPLKERYTWKPSDEQMEVLVWCKPLFADPKLKGILESLINDLKELRGE